MFRPPFTMILAHVFPVLHLLVTLTSISYAWNLKSPRSEQCAEIFFHPAYQGPAFFLSADEQFSDLSDVQYYIRKQLEKNEASQPPSSGEHDNDNQESTIPTPKGMSFRVHEGCSLTLASKAFLKGKIHGYSGNVEDLPEESLAPLSASCECPKTCTCEDNKLRRTECGRAYLHDDCTNCKAPFTSLKPGGNWNNFPERWTSKVKTMILRAGCDVSIIHDSQIHTFSWNDTSSTKQIVKDVSDYGNITRYQCTCSENPIESDSENETRNENYPPSVSIPKTKGAINALLSNETRKGHPGLMASLQSIRKKRSSKNAYILLLGMTGSGKSSAVNLLFDHPNITKTGDFVSTTTDILQFTLPVPVNDLGMKNTALHVIDTPGIGDTGGVAEDARFLASFEDFLNNHEDLKRNLPNVVLIFSKFSDNRFSGIGASFVKMLRTIDLFKDKIIDKRSTNVIFVLTHYMAETKEVTRDPGYRIKRIREVIQEFSSLPRPIHIVLAENKPDAAHLPLINGFYRLPNGEFYPKNLFDQMQRNLMDNGDPVGGAIIREAFSNSDSFNISGKRYPLMLKTDPKVTKYLGRLGSFNQRITETEISTELRKAYDLLDSQLKSGYPQILKTMQRALFVRNILHKVDLPQTSAEILRLLQEIPINQASLFLLRTAFNIAVPEFQKPFLVGSGYSLVQDETLPAPIFKRSDDKSSDILFTIPETYNVALQNRLDKQFHVFKSRHKFIGGRMKALGLDEDAIPTDPYSSSLTGHPGFNLVTFTDSKNESLESPQISWNALTATVDYRTFEIGLSQKVVLSDDFSNAVELLKPLNLTEPDSVQSWRQFFDRYGTHVVTHAFGGGTIIVTTKIQETPNHEGMSNPEKFAILSETMANIIQQLANELIGKDAVYQPPSGVEYSFSQIGGNFKHFWSNFSDLDEVRNIDEWRESLKYDPVILKSKLELHPISEVVNDMTKNRDLAYSIEEAASSLLNASLVYIPRAHNYDNTPTSRDKIDGSGESGDFQSLEAFSQMFKTIAENNRDAQSQLIKVMAETRKRINLEEEKYQERMLQFKRDQAEADRVQREADQFDEEVKLRQEAMNSQRLLQEEALRFQKEQARLQNELQQQAMVQEINARNERTMLNLIDMQNKRDAEIIKNSKPGWRKFLDTVCMVCRLIP